MFKTMFSVLVLSLSVSAAAAQELTPDVTVQLRDGTRVDGRIEEMLPDGTLFLRVSLHDQRRIPLGDIALIDRVGGARGLPDTELREAAGSEHLLLTRDGNSVKGRLVAIRGGVGSAQTGQTRTYVFRTQEGVERTYPMDQVARIYTGSYSIAAISGGASQATGNAAPGLEQGIDVPGSVRVPAASGWVSTGRRVRQGDVVGFTTTGQVQLSTNTSDRAHSAGTPRTAPGAPMPDVYAGGLIGRIGNGEPFAIGNQTSVTMPGEGILYLAVNDDERGDNSGEFVVQLRLLRRR